MPQARTHWYYSDGDPFLWRYPVGSNTGEIYLQLGKSYVGSWYTCLTVRQDQEPSNRLTKAEARYRFPLAFKK